MPDIAIMCHWQQQSTFLCPKITICSATTCLEHSVTLTNHGNRLGLLSWIFICCHFNIKKLSYLVCLKWYVCSTQDWKQVVSYKSILCQFLQLLIVWHLHPTVDMLVESFWTSLQQWEVNIWQT